MDIDLGVITCRNRAASEVYIGPIEIPISGYGSLTVTKTNFEFVNARVTQSDTRQQTVRLDEGSKAYYSSQHELGIFIELIGPLNNGKLALTPVIYPAFGTTSLARYDPFSSYYIEVFFSQFQTTVKIKFILDDSWGPTFYCFRNNGRTRTSGMDININISEDGVQSPATGMGVGKDYGDYYTISYNFETYKQTYNVKIPFMDISYSGHNFIGWTQYAHDPSYSPPFVPYANINIIATETTVLPLQYNALLGVGAVWRENSCPEIYGLNNSVWAPALEIRVLNNNTWNNVPAAIYVYSEGQWNLLPNSG